MVTENFLPDIVSSLILDLERDGLLPSISRILRLLRLRLGLDAQVVLGVHVPGWCGAFVQ